MWPIRRVFRLCWWILCTLTFIALPLMIWDFRRKHYDIKLQAWFVGGIFVLVSIPISLYEIALHTEYYTQPRLQRHVIRILWMVPIYGVDAWLALRFRDAREYLDPIRECYEAFVIWSFYSYLMAYLEDQVGNVESYLARHKPGMSHFPPFKWILRPWPMGHRFLLETKKGVMNYVIVRPVTTAIGLITDVYGKYGQGRVDLHKSYIYLAVAASFSQLWALYCLAQLYWVCHDELAPLRPLSKFLCIKAVVFLTFWQGVVLAILVSGGVISDESWSTYDQLGVATGIQDFLVCIEMFVAALAHAYAFPPRDYMAGAPTGGFVTNVRHMFDLRDVVHDIGEVVESHVDTAAEAVTQSAQAVLYVPKKAVRTVGKGLSYLTSEGNGKRSGKGGGGSRRRSGETEGDEGEDEEQGLLQGARSGDGQAGLSGGGVSSAGSGGGVVPGAGDGQEQPLLSRVHPQHPRRSPVQGTTGVSSPHRGATERESRPPRRHGTARHGRSSSAGQLPLMTVTSTPLHTLEPSGSDGVVVGRSGASGAAGLGVRSLIAQDLRQGSGEAGKGPWGPDGYSPPPRPGSTPLLGARRSGSSGSVAPTGRKGSPPLQGGEVWAPCVTQPETDNTPPPRPLSVLSRGKRGSSGGSLTQARAVRDEHRPLLDDHLGDPLGDG